tara:strand:- start:16442 stop:17041 length:600 start_codon:yes stop_codon:yes gene_type:complete
MHIEKTPDAQLLKTIDLICDFHGKYAPGAVIGAYMVELAQEKLQPLKGKLNAIAESTVCLADAIQIMTGCTIGNKYLWLMNYGRYALCLYDRETKEGVRVWVDYHKIDPIKTPTLKKFFDGSRTYEIVDRPTQQQMVNQEFFTVKRAILSWKKVWVNLPAKGPLPDTAFCIICNEYFKSFLKPPKCKCTMEELYSETPL